MEAGAAEVSSQEFSSRDLRSALGAFPTGVTVITTQGTEHPYGMTANAFSAVSLDPPLVLVCVIDGTEGKRSIDENGVFAVNVLHAQQEPVSRHFSSRDRPRGYAAFDNIPHHRVVTGSPILDGAAAFLDCRVAASHQAGDHVIFIGEVVAIGHDQDALPLLFHRGQYRYLPESAPGA
jgi:flavin reductase (DIM6/NTAB) family NADH-FMN oxidoreductase RutF